MPSKTTSSTPARLSSRTGEGKLYKVTFFIKTADAYMKTPKQVADSLKNQYFLQDYCTDWAIEVETTDADTFEKALA